MEGPRIVFLIFIFLFLFLTPDTQPPTPNQLRAFKKRIESEQRALDLLIGSRFGDFDAAAGKYLQVTGLREKDGFAWDLLPEAKERAQRQTINALGQEATSELERLDAGSRNNGSVFVPVAPLYNNVSSVLSGQWIKTRITNTPPKLNLTSLAPGHSYVTHEFNRNITNDEGKITVILNEREDRQRAVGFSDVRDITAEVALVSPTSPGNGWEFTLHGIHIPDSGQIILTTSSEKFTGIFTLPHFAPSERIFNLSHQLLNSTLSEAIAKQNVSHSPHPVFPGSSSSEDLNNALFPTPSCEYIMFLQQRPVWFSGINSPTVNAVSLVRSIERELRFPEGAPVPYAPQITMSAVLYSPDCGYILETKGPPAFSPEDGLHLLGPKLESYNGLVKDVVLGIILVLTSQIALLYRQMQDASTPSTRSRVSFNAIAMMCLGDGLMGLGLAVFSVGLESNFLPLLSATFFSSLSVSLLGMRFLANIWYVQAPERIERERQREAARPTPARRPAQSSTLPPPAVAPRPVDTGATPVTLPPNQNLETAQAQDNAPLGTTQNRTPGGEFGAMYSHFYFILAIVSLSALWAFHWPTPLRSAYVNTLGFLYLSYWIPQIHRNAMRNCRKALRWEFVIGQSILRLLPLAYVYLKPRNIFLSEPDSTAFLILAGWVWIQNLALFSQDLVGPRFFVPKGWVPPAYDYHPVLREDDIEAGTMPIGSNVTDHKDALSRTNSRTGRSRRSYDCAICMQNIEVAISPGSESTTEGTTSLATNLLGRRTYMVTPCRHIFHSACLEGWMKFRLQCPICREALPAL